MSEAILQAAEWEGDQVVYALAQLDSMRASVEAPWNLLADVSAIYVYLDAGDVEAARKAIESIRALQELFGESEWRLSGNLYYLGRVVELEEGDCARSIDNYREAVDLWESSAPARRWLARCLTSLERWDEAEAEVDWFLARYPGYARYRLLAARLYAARGRTADAIAELELALEIWSEADPDYRPAAEARALLSELGSDGPADPSTEGTTHGR